MFGPGDDLVDVAVGVFGAGSDGHSQALALVAAADVDTGADAGAGLETSRRIMLEPELDSISGLDHHRDSHQVDADLGFQGAEAIHAVNVLSGVHVNHVPGLAGDNAEVSAGELVGPFGELFRVGGCLYLPLPKVGVLSGVAGHVRDLALALDEATAGAHTCGRVDSVDGENAAEPLGKVDQLGDALGEG